MCLCRAVGSHLSSLCGCVIVVGLAPTERPRLSSCRKQNLGNASPSQNLLSGFLTSEFLLRIPISELLVSVCLSVRTSVLQTLFDFHEQVLIHFSQRLWNAWYTRCIVLTQLYWVCVAVVYMRHGTYGTLVTSCDLVITLLWLFYSTHCRMTGQGRWP
jgi:hypothetical protein